MLTTEEVFPMWAVTVGVALPLVAILLACICCKKTVPKNELMGLAGMVKITNPEENSNHNNQNSDACTVLPCATDTAPNNANKRASTTANRSLPDIPKDSERVHLESGDTVWEGSEPNDTSSELYATVEENKHTAEPLVSANNTDAPSVNMKRLTHEESKSSEHSSLSQTDDSFSPYTRLKKENPYDKLRDTGCTTTGEHPYAQVGATNSELSNSIYDTATQNYANHRTSIQNEVLQLPQPSTSSDTTGNNPIPPPRTRKSSSHNSLVHSPSSESVPDIQAATAIAGRISANQELPYMTPPIQQTNYSGDSQDLKGYTSISVREPLAKIKAETKVANQKSRTQELMDSHYATVSDDSDEMYAAIDEPGQVYTSGSETYAQIQQATTADGTHYPPQPPSVDSLKQVAQVHSRQASSSSATSSVANLGSPKPEKRQANSPLPPPPAAGSPELLCAPVDKATMSRNLEEMYAKVMKKKQREQSEGSSSQGSPTQPEVDTVSAASGSDLEFVPLPEIIEPSYESLGGPNSIDPGYEEVQRMASDCDPNYEELKPQSDEGNGRTDPGYEQVGATALPNYEEVRPQNKDLSDDCDESVTEDTERTDPSYEQVTEFHEVQKSREECSKLEMEFPGYEQVGAAASLEDGYAKVNKNRGNTPQESVDIWVNLGGYEHVRSQSKDNPNQEAQQDHRNGERPSSSDDTYSGPEPDYASVNRDNPEPNYESMSSEANYESVSYFDPPYERLHNEARDSDDTSSNYEKVSNTQWDAINGNTNLCRM